MTGSATLARTRYETLRSATGHTETHNFMAISSTRKIPNRAPKMKDASIVSRAKASATAVQISHLGLRVSRYRNIDKTRRTKRAQSITSSRM